MPAPKKRGAREAFLAALEGGHTRTSAAGIAGVARKTTWRWMESPAFTRRVEAAEAAFVESMLAVVRRAAARSAPRTVHAAIDLLGRRNREFRPGVRFEHDDEPSLSPQGHAAVRVIEGIDAMPPDEQAAHVREMRRLEIESLRDADELRDLQRIIERRLQRVAAGVAS
jgi:hypothetical protein